MKKRKILVVDDDVFIAEQLNAILSDLGYAVIGIATSSEMAIKLIDEDAPDLALLDIKMHGVNQGFSIAKYLKKNNEIPFIFVTSFADKDTVSEASSLDPMAYILKPFNEHDIFSTLEIVFAKINNNKKYLTLNSELGKFNVNMRDVLWIKSDDKYLQIQTEEKTYLHRSTLSNVLEQLDQNIFCQVHRSYIVNLNHVDFYRKNQLTIRELEIPISRSYLPNFKTKFEAR